MSAIVPLNNNYDNTQNLAGWQEAQNADPGVRNRTEENTAAGLREKKTTQLEECETCKNRRYQDGSDDPGVSFKSPTKMSPTQAASQVYSHEREHYTREAAKAEKEGREVLENSICVFTGVCAECGKVYVSGGETKTVTRKKMEQAQSLKDFYDERLGGSRATAMDAKV